MVAALDLPIDTAGKADLGAKATAWCTEKASAQRLEAFMDDMALT
jgi:hypothetical protein